MNLEQIVPIDATLIIDAISMQRDRAMTEAALAMARSVHFQKENALLQTRIAELEKKE